MIAGERKNHRPDYVHEQMTDWAGSKLREELNPLLIIPAVYIFLVFLFPYHAGNSLQDEVK